MLLTNVLCGYHWKNDFSFQELMKQRSKKFYNDGNESSTALSPSGLPRNMTDLLTTGIEETQFQSFPYRARIA